MRNLADHSTGWLKKLRSGWRCWLRSFWSWDVKLQRPAIEDENHGGDEAPHHNWRRLGQIHFSVR